MLPHDLLAVGDVIPKGVPIRLAWNVGSIPSCATATALQTFCVTDYFRVKAEVVVIRGGAGTGKSYTRDRIVRELMKRKLNTICMAPTGLVAQSMPAGLWKRREISAQTVQWFILHPPTVEDGEFIKHLHIIIDEYTMVSSSDLEAVWKIAARLCPKARLTLLGDHAQLWPVRGLPPWSSERLKIAQSNGNMVVYRLVAQQRYGDCERMKTLIDALRNRQVPTANSELYRIALRAPPSTGSCRLIAATHALSEPANSRVHAALATQPNAAKTTFKGVSEEEGITLCNGERVKVCTNKFEAQPGGGVLYTQVNGQEGFVRNLTGGSVTVTKDTRVELRLLGKERKVLHVAPRQVIIAPDQPDDEKMFDDDETEDGAIRPAKRAKRRGSRVYTFVGALKKSSGQTAHSVQGSTFGRNERCVVDLAGFPQSILGYHMLIVALSRVQRVQNIFVLNYDPAMISRLAAMCPCGCVTTGPHLRSHNSARLASFEAHMAALHANVRAVFEESSTF